MCALCDWFQHAAVSPISDIVDEEVKKEVEEVVQDSLKRAQTVLNLTISSAENIQKYHPRNLDPAAAASPSYQTASILGAGWVIFALMMTLVLVLVWYMVMVLKGMRGQLDLDMETMKGAPPRNTLAFTNPFNPRQPPASSDRLSAGHHRNSHELTPSGSELQISVTGGESDDADSVAIPYNIE